MTLYELLLKTAHETPVLLQQDGKDPCKGTVAQILDNNHKTRLSQVIVESLQLNPVVDNEIIIYCLGL